MNLSLGKSTGNRAVAEALDLAFRQNRFPHAVLLEGGMDGGARELALQLAKAAVCTSQDGKPCGVCPGCIKAQAGSHPDIQILDGESCGKAFPVDAIRSVRSSAYILPNEAPHRVFVLLGVQNMSEISQNALLKVLEEPPDNVLFLLTVSSSSALLPTIRSRTQIFSLVQSRPSGNWEEAAAIAHAVPAPREAELLFSTAGLIRDRDQLRMVLDQLFFIFRDAEIRRSGGNSCLSNQSDTAAALGEQLTRGCLLKLMEETQNARRLLDLNANTALLVTTYCAALREAAGR